MSGASRRRTCVSNSRRSRHLSGPIGVTSVTAVTGIVPETTRVTRRRPGSTSTTSLTVPARPPRGPGAKLHDSPPTPVGVPGIGNEKARGSPCSTGVERGSSMKSQTSSAEAGTSIAAPSLRTTSRSMLGPQRTKRSLSQVLPVPLRVMFLDSTSWGGGLSHPPVRGTRADPASRLSLARAHRPRPCR